MYVRNRVKELYSRGEIAFGTFATFQTSATVEVAALAGLDFVRLDPYHIAYNPETLQAMISMANAYSITPWLRVNNDQWSIMKALDMGADALTIPNIGTAEEATSVVSAVHYPPYGERDYSRPLRFSTMPAQEFFEWARNEVLVSVQIEGQSGVEHYKEIINVDGIDVIQTGRNDLSLALGVPGEDSHAKVLDAEARIVEAALEAGKQVALLQPMTDEGIERAKSWISKGVKIMTLDADHRVLLRNYQHGLGILGQ